MHALQVDVVRDDPEPVRLEDHDRLAAADSLREAVDPREVLGSRRRPACRVLQAVPERQVVRDENGDAVLERCGLHRPANLLLRLCRRPARDPDGVPLRDHRCELERALEVALTEQVDPLPHRVGARCGDVEAGSGSSVRGPAAPDATGASTATATPAAAHRSATRSVCLTMFPLS